MKSLLLIVISIVLIAISCKESTLGPEDEYTGNVDIVYTKLLYDSNYKVNGSEVWGISLADMKRTKFFDSAAFVAEPFGNKLLCLKGILESDDNQYSLYSGIPGTENWNLIGKGIPYGGKRFVVSPDRTKLLLTNTVYLDEGDIHNATEIFICNIDGSNLLKLVGDAMEETTPLFFPNSTKIAYLKQNGDYSVSGDSIFTINLDGSDKKFITDGVDADGFFESFDISPDGQYFVADDEVTQEIALISVDGSTKTLLTNEGTDCHNPEFSKDGSKIVYIRYEKHVKSSVNIINIDGSGRKELFNTNLDSGSLDESVALWPTWSNDGSKIAFCDYDTGKPDPSSGNLIVVDVNTLQATILDSQIFRAFWMK